MTSQNITGTFMCTFKNFIMTDVDKPSTSKTTLIGNIPWQLAIERTEKDGKSSLEVFLSCNHGNVSTLWSIDACYTVQLISKKPEKNYVKKVTNPQLFKAKKNNRGWFTFIEWENLLNNENAFFHGYSLKMRVDVEIRRMIGLQYLHFDYSTPMEFSDFAFVVEGKLVYVNKDYLSIHSPYFKTLFFSETDGEKKNQATLTGVSYDDFIDFLAAFQPVPKKASDQNIKTRLKLAKRFQVPQVTWHCNRYLTENYVSEDVNILKLAEKYGLADAHNELLDDITADEIQDLRDSDDYANYSRNTVDSLVDRLLELSTSSD